MKKENEIETTGRAILAANRGSSLFGSVLDCDHCDLFDRILERCDSVYVLSEEEAKAITHEDRD